MGNEIISETRAKQLAKQSILNKFSSLQLLYPSTIQSNIQHQPNHTAHTKAIKTNQTLTNSFSLSFQVSCDLESTKTATIRNIDSKLNNKYK